MIEVAALTGGKNDPSARFRVRQYIPSLGAAGIHVREFFPRIDKHTPSPVPPPFHYLWSGVKLAAHLPGVLRSRGQQIVWIQRELLLGRHTLEGRVGAPRVFDVDDAIWLGSSHAPAAMRRIGREAEIVFAGNTFIANWFEPHARRIEIIPTAIDTDRFTPALKTPGRFVVGWTGTHWNLPYLEGLETPLRRFLDRHGDAELLVVANRRPTFPRLPSERVRYVPWTPEIEVKAVQEMSVGLMPLVDDEFTRGKCSFKMLQYMACGLPVVVSPVGMNGDLLGQAQVGVGASSDVQWFEALEMLYSDPARSRQWGQAGRRLVEQRYSCAIVSELIRKAFVTLV